MAKLSKTQIEAIITKLSDDYTSSEPKDRHHHHSNANQLHMKAIVKKELSPFTFKLLDKQINPYQYGYMVEKLTSAKMKQLGFPYPEADAYYAQRQNNRETFNGMVNGLRFELVMAGTDDYQGYMDAFTKRVNKAFGHK